MAHEAAIRLTLSNAQFITGIKGSSTAVTDMSRKSKAGMDAFGASADRAKQKVIAIGSAAKSALRWTTSLGGAFTVASMIKGATQLQRTYRQIAFGVRDANGQMLKASEVQKLAERSAAATGQSNADMAQSFRDILDATGDLDFSRKVLETIGTTSMATGAELDTVGTLADQLHTKFGVSADGMLDAMAEVFDAAKQGGPKFQDYADAASNVGAELLAAGIGGKKGLDFMLGSLVRTDDEFKSLPKQVAGLKAVLRGLSEKGELSKLALKVGIDPKTLINEKDALTRVRHILSTGAKGSKALLEPLHEGEEKRTMEILFTNPFKKALADAQKTGLKGKAAIDAALKTFDAGLAEFGKSGLDGAAMQRRADEERKSPEAQLTLALDKLSTAFSQPAIIQAINDLAVQLPKLADILGEIVSFAAAHPILAGAAAVGGNVLTDVAGEALGSGASALGGKLIQKLFGKGAGAAVGGAGGGLAGSAAEIAASGISRFHQMGGEGGLTASMLEGLPEALTAGEAAAAGIAPAITTGLSALALPIGAAIAAATMGYGIHKLNVEDDASSELGSATAAAFGGGTKKQKQAALARLQAAQKGAADADTGGGPLDWIARTVTGVDSRQGAADQMKLADEAIAKLRADLAKTGAPGGGKGPIVLPDTNIVGRVKVDAEGTRAIGIATATALGGRVLDVRITNAGDLGLGRANAGPGGSRGPMAAGTPRQGGSV